MRYRPTTAKPVVVWQEVIMTRDDLIREYKERSGTWPALVAVYGLILGTMVLTGVAMVG